MQCGNYKDTHVSFYKSHPNPVLDIPDSKDPWIDIDLMSVLMLLLSGMVRLYEDFAEYRLCFEIR